MVINVDMAYVLGDYTFTLESEMQRLFEIEAAVEASAAQSEEQQKKLYQLSCEARAEIVVAGSEVSLRLYFLSIPEETDDYADLIIMNAYDNIGPKFNESLHDILDYPDVRDRMVEQTKPQIEEKINTVFGGGS